MWKYQFNECINYQITHDVDDFQGQPWQSVIHLSPSFEGI